MTMHVQTEALGTQTAVVRPKAQWVRTLRVMLSFGRTKAGIAVLAFVIAVAVIGPFVAPFSPTQFVGVPFEMPSAENWLGTDNLGRDVLSRALCGGWTVLTLSTAATLIGVALGVYLGLMAGHARPWVDETVMRILDVILAFPALVFALLCVSIAGPRLWLIVLAVAISHAPRVARVARGATLEVCSLGYIHAMEALGLSPWRTRLGEILPNITSPILVEFGMRVAYSVGIIAALSFLGFGMQPPTPDWGLMINENRLGISVQPFSVVAPVVLIALLAVGVSLIADGLSRTIVGTERETSHV